VVEYQHLGHTMVLNKSRATWMGDLSLSFGGEAGRSVPMSRGRIRLRCFAIRYSDGPPL
jgi:hypothetical protein